MTLRNDDLPDDIDAGERVQLEAVAAMLHEERPYPGAAFRSRLREALHAGERRTGGLFAALQPAYGLVGSGLLLLAGLGPLGVGPFAP